MLFLIGNQIVTSFFAAQVAGGRTAGVQRWKRTQYTLLKRQERIYSPIKTTKLLYLIQSITFSSYTVQMWGVHVGVSFC